MFLSLFFFSLSKDSAIWLSEKGYLPFEEVINTASRMQDVRKTSEGSDESELPDMGEGHSKVSEGYCEVEQIVDRRINPATQAFEYLVRFNGYSECHDLWLLASSFNMPLNHVSISSMVESVSGVQILMNLRLSTAQNLLNANLGKSLPKNLGPPKIIKMTRKKRGPNLASNVGITFVADQDVSFCVQGKAGEVAKT